MYQRIGKICREVEQSVPGVSIRALLDTESIRFEIAVSAKTGVVFVLDYPLPYTQFDQMVNPLDQVQSLLKSRAEEAKGAATEFTKSAED